MEINTDQLIEKANYAINEGKKLGMEGVNINSELNRILSTRFANSSIHQNFVDFETKFQITAIQGKKNVIITTNSIEEKDILLALNKAAKIIVYLPDDPEFPGVMKDVQKYPKIKINDPKAKNLAPSDVADKIIEGMNKSHELSPKVQSVSGSFNLKDGVNFFLSSEGSENLTPATSIISTINIMSNDGHGESRSNASVGSRRFLDLRFKEESENAAERSLLGLNAQKIEPKSYPAILDYQAVADQVFHIGIAMSARYVLDQASFVKDKVGEQVFATSLSVINDPHDPDFFSANPIDSEGVPTQKYTLINNGVVENFAHSRLTASKMGAKISNGSACILFGTSIPLPFASKILPGNKSRQQLIEEMDDGLLVTNFHYSNFIDMPRGTETGMTKDGLFIIKNGEIVGSAKNMRFNDSITNMFSKAEISSETVQTPNFYGYAYDVPAIRIKELNFSSKTDH